MRKTVSVALPPQYLSAQKRTLCAAMMALLPLIACGPVPLQQAERQCAARAYLAQGPQTSLGVRFNSDGTSQIGGSFGISTDYIAGRDPDQVFRDCVAQQSGKFPEHSYQDYPNSRP